MDGNWAAELTRYQRLVQPEARTVAVFATGDLGDTGDTGEVIGSQLPASSGLRQEWFIVVQAEEFCCALFGVDRPEPGAELPLDEMDRLFRPFVTTKLDRGGTGLGLMLAQRFAQECNGSLTLRSTGAAGTVFALALPVLSGGIAHMGAAEADVAEDAAGEVEPGFGAGVPARVALVLDDDSAIRATLGRMLERSGWQVLLAATADAAVGILATQPCDVLLADWGVMSEGPGCDVLSRRLEAARPGCTARMVVITGSLASTLPDGLVPMVLSKPFGSRQLQDEITRLAGD